MAGLGHRAGHRVALCGAAFGTECEGRSMRRVQGLGLRMVRISGLGFRLGTAPTL